MKGTRSSRWKIVLLCTLLLSGCKGRQEKGPIVAIVGDEALSLAELLGELPTHIRSGLTSMEVRASVIEWINGEVLYQEAKALRLNENPSFQREFGQLKKELLINKLIERTLRQNIQVSDDEIQAYYDANSEGFVLSEDLVRAYHIITETRQEANKIRTRLRAGELFEDLAKEVGGDSLANIDWDWGYFSRNDVIPEISKVVFKLGVNSYSTPVKSDLGYHIFKVVDKQKSGDVKKLETLQEEIRLKLLEKKKQDKYQRFLLQMKSKYKIQTNFQLLDSAVLDSLLHHDGA